jgi:hypothetical protein
MQVIVSEGAPSAAGRVTSEWADLAISNSRAAEAR